MGTLLVRREWPNIRPVIGMSGSTAQALCAEPRTVVERRLCQWLSAAA
jgi:hypothetical protein